MAKKFNSSLIMRYIAGECTDAEIKEIRDCMEKDQSFKDSINKLQKIMNAKEEPAFQTDIDIAWRRMRSRIEMASREESQPAQRQVSWRMPWSQLVPSYTIPARRLLQFAAALIFIFASSLFLIQHFHNDSNQMLPHYQTVSVDKGQRINVDLSDGTRITLDAGSELRFPLEFKDSRDVYLKGEAYFEAAHDSKRPFRVHANHALISVLGTKFNIRAWQETERVSVAVVEGKVAFSMDDGSNGKGVVVSKGFFSSLPQRGQPSKPIRVNPQQHLGWMNNEIYFHDVSLREVLAQLERWYEFQFVIKEPSILEERMTIHLQRTNVDDVLELISIITDTDIDRSGKIITMIPKNSGASGDRS